MPAKDFVMYQAITDRVRVYYASGKVEQAEAPLEGVKTYIGFDPAGWDTDKTSLQTKPVNYRAGLDPGIPETPGAIPLRLIEMTKDGDE